MKYEEFKVLIEDTERIRATRRNGITIKGRVQMDTLKNDTIKIFHSWLARGRIQERKELEVLGSYLYSVLFSGEIGVAFKAEFDEIQTTKGHWPSCSSGV